MYFCASFVLRCYDLQSIASIFPPEGFDLRGRLIRRFSCLCMAPCCLLDFPPRPLLYLIYYPLMHLNCVTECAVQLGARTLRWITWLPRSQCPPRKLPCPVFSYFSKMVWFSLAIRFPLKVLDHLFSYQKQMGQNKKKICSAFTGIIHAQIGNSHGFVFQLTFTLHLP